MRQHIHWKATAEKHYSLNLDEAFFPLINSIPIQFKKFLFLGGEPHFQILDSTMNVGSRVTITQRYKSPADLIDILIASDALRRLGFRDIHLLIPYFPAARQDRVCNDGEPLTVKVFADLINGCNFESVTILSPHSEVTPALLNNVIVLDEIAFIDTVFNRNKEGHHFNIVCPDAGAGKRVMKIAEYLAKTYRWFSFHLIRCEKVRDVTDGSLKEFFVQSDDLCGYPTLIVDDINSRGGTFLGLAEKLREKNCGKLILFTSHADCAIGVDNVVRVFDAYYTTNSKRDLECTFHDFGKFTCMKIELP
jgi:ribose-phosphate pyrophosphokinase